MSWRTEKTDEGSDLVYDGVEKGIAVSPTQGTANIQNANISTETGEVMASYGRTAQQQASITSGTLTASVSDGTAKLAAPSTLKGGQWVTVTAATVTIDGPTAPIDYLVVGGGASGGATAASNSGGGGGAGDVVPGSTTVALGAYSITVGNGGTAATAGANDGVNGSSSVLGSTATATGGSKGGAGNGGGGVANAGGSGSGSGGGGGSASGGGTGGAAGTAGAGTNVHNGGAGNNTAGAGGGGGASTAGASFTGVGGTGLASSISGSSITYGVGGNGDGTGTAGTANRGNGGNGTNNGSNPSGAGGKGVVIIRYLTTDLTATGGTITTDGLYTVHTFTSTGTFTVTDVNFQITLPTGNYFVDYKDSSNKVKLSYYYDPYGLNPIVHSTSGTVTFNTLTTPHAGLAKATETYGTATNTEYRYYILDSSGYVWVYDTAVYDSTLAANGVGMTWMLPDPTDYSASLFTGIGVLNGWLFALRAVEILGKPTTTLGSAFTGNTVATLLNPFPGHINFAYTGHQGKLFYTDKNFLGEIFPTISFITGGVNIQSFASYTAVTTTGTMTALISGSIPSDLTGGRIPAVFFTDQYGTQPTNLTAETVYYVDAGSLDKTFNVYAAITGGSQIDIAAGATGNQYFNTFFPTGADAGGGQAHATVQVTQQRVNFPTFEVLTCMVEIGNTVLVGGITNTVYPWNQVDATPSDFIPLPETGVVAMTNVNNTAYILAGNKGNIYISNGSVASHVLKVPDYCAGVPGTPLTYIEPYFTWGDIEYIRGRVYFSILDQTATKAGNTGGVWSFLPAENFSSQDGSLALRLENQNSYGDYDGYARLIIGNQEQQAISPQYWTAWQDSYSTGTSVFGIDQTATTPVTTFVIETDLLPTGSFLSKDTFQQLEYKLTTPATSGDGVQFYYRLNSTDAWTSCGTVVLETANPISGYFEQVFQKTQWVQFRLVCTTNGTTSSSFVRLKQVMLR